MENRTTLDQIDGMMKKHIDVLVEKKAASDAHLEARVSELHEEAEKREAAAAKSIQELQSDASKTLARQRDLEQKVDSTFTGFSGVSTAYSTLGKKLVGDDRFKHIAQGNMGSMTVTLNESEYPGYEAVVINPAPPTVATNTLVDPSPHVLLPPAVRRLRMRDLIPSVRTVSNVIQYTVENVFTDNAAPQAITEGTALGESSVTFTTAELPIRTVGHFIKMSEQILEDAPALQGYIDGRMRFLLAQEEEDQLLLGNGVAPNLTGLAPNATDYDNSLTATGDNQIDKLRHAILQVFNSNFAADGIVLNPTDWSAIELLKRDSATTSTNVSYVVGDPVSGTIQRLWGLPVVETNAITANDFLVGSFALSSQIWDRREPSVQLALQDDTDFQKLMVTLRVTERLCLTVFRPLAIVTGDFTWPTGSPI